MPVIVKSTLKPRPRFKRKTTPKVLANSEMQNYLHIAISECPEAITVKILKDMIKNGLLYEDIMRAIKKPTEAILSPCLKFMRHDSDNGDWAGYLRYVSTRHKFSKAFNAKIWKVINYIESDGDYGD